MYASRSAVEGMIGLKRGRVELLPHNEQWHTLFEEEARRLKMAIGDSAVAMEHIGSTAICGIAAKPILDIMVGIKPFVDELPSCANIVALGYNYKGENGIPERHYFGKGEPRTVHLNVVEFAGQFWLGHLAFRDHLTRDHKAAVDYDKLKRVLAKRFPNDREAYTSAKAEFINRILSLSRKQI